MVIKFFYDLPSTEENDRLLESVTFPLVALQASFERCRNDELFNQRFDALPLPAILFPAKRRSFHRALAVAPKRWAVDSTESEIPIFELYQGRLKVVAVGGAGDGEQPKSRSRSIRFREGRDVHPDMSIALPFLPQTRFHIPSRHLNRSCDLARKGEGSIVFGYDGKNIHSIDTPLGAVGAHRFFIFGLLSLTHAFEKAQGGR